MNTKRFALILGIIYLVVGVAGFFPALIQPPSASDPAMTVTALQGNLFGLFPVNLLHTLVHLAVGAWGVVATRSEGASLFYARALAVIFGVLTIMGLVPGLNTGFGLIPLHSHDIWLHAATAIVSGYFGFSSRAKAHI